MVSKPVRSLRDSIMLIAGWALGILSSPTTDMIRRRSAKHRLTRVILTELRSLQDTLALVVIQVSRRRGALTRPLLEALLTTLKSSDMPSPRVGPCGTIDGLLELDEDNLTAGQPLDLLEQPTRALAQGLRTADGGVPPAPARSLLA